MPAKPKIVTSLYQVPEMADKVRAAIEDINQPSRIFSRSEDMVRVVAGGDGRLLVRGFDAGSIKAEAEKAIVWRKPRTGGDVPSRVPTEVVDFLVHAEPIWPELPFLRRLVHAPVILPDARILSISGYDPGTQLFLALDPGFALPPVPDDPTEDDLMRASSYVQSYLDEFVFAEPADAANALGMFIGHLLRPLLGEEALLPMFDIDAPTQATGKTALANATGVLALGAAPKLVPEIKDADEMRKQITSMLVGENELMLFDNLTQKLDDASLAAALTGEGMWGGRLLGTNNLANARANTTFIATGNNLEIGPDLRRRSVYIRMDANMADPSQRRFRRADFLGMLRDARPRLLAALFTWIRRWLQHGSPSAGAPIMVGYNPFVRAVHGLLSLVGREQWLGNLHNFRQNQDPETAVWGRWLAEWHRLWASEPVPSAELAKALNDQGNATYQAFGDLRPDDLATYTQIDREKLATTLGHVLGRQVDRVFDEFKLMRATRADGIRRWRVVPLDRVEPPESPESPSTEPDAGAHAHEERSALIQSQEPPVTEDVYTANAQVSLVPIVSIDSRSRPAIGKSAYVRDKDTNGTNGTNDTEIEAVRVRARQAIAEQDLLVLKMTSLDTETTGLKTWQGAYVRLVAMDSGDKNTLVDVQHLRRGERKRLVDFLRDEHGSLIPMHNARFDLTMLTTADLPMPPLHRVFDTMLAAQLLDASAGVSGKYGLDDLALRYLGETMDKTLQVSDWSGELTDEQRAYARKDAEVTRRLALVLEREIRLAGMDQVLAIETEFLAFMVELELHGGLPVDVVAWMAQQEQLEDERLVLEARLAAVYQGQKPKRWSARTWLQNYIREQGYTTGLTADGKPQISAPALEEYASDPLIAAYLAWKKLDTRSNGWGQEYLDANVAADNCFHGDYRQLGTRTGRLSCSRPNLQQIPRVGGLREAIHPPEGRCFIKADYSQLQLVIVADESKDQVMCQAYDPEVAHKDRPDLHTITARSVLGLKVPEGEKIKGAQRVICKNINFGLCYGMGAARLAGIIERETGQECDIEIAKLQRYRYFQTYSGVAHWHGLGKHRSSRGRTHEDEEYPNPIEIRTPAGRRRTNVVDFTQKVNSPIQMREADGVKTGLALLVPRLKAFHDARPVMMIHDEVIVECDLAEARQVRETIERALEEGMNRWLRYTTATVEADVVRDYAGTEFEENGG